jgi:molybdopterin-containing oxidoreductase family membrane subunit
VVFVISILVNVGMWFERFVIVVGGLYREFLPSNWGFYSPTWVDICTYIGTFGFQKCFLLFRFPADDCVEECATPQSRPHNPLAKRTEANTDGATAKTYGIIRV